MSLHGTVKVNGKALLYWSARNTGVTNINGATVYECGVGPTDYFVGLVKFEVGHWPRHGAAVLAALVLTEYASITGVPRD